MGAPTRSPTERARRVLERTDALAGFSEEHGRLTRFYGTSALVEASRQVSAWMAEAGMEVRTDAVGNVIGRLEPDGDGIRGTVVVGSHLDSVRDAGRYDGALGVLLGIEAADEMRTAGLPFAFEVVSFADEEGARFGTAYLGSRAYIGRFDGSQLGCVDADGVTLEEAITAMGGDPAPVGSSRSAPADLLAFLEVHIEQGPILQERGLPVGIVTGITGQSGGSVVFTGAAGHAGTTPMHVRRDALAAAAAFVLEVERTGRERHGLVATVGRISNDPNLGNVIAGHTTVSFDVRSADDGAREAAVADLREATRAICAERGLDLGWHTVHDEPAVPMSAGLREILSRACAGAGVEACDLESGAGHDGVSLAQLTPEVAMLFVRCKDGISHNPAESVREDDVAVAHDVLVRALRLLGEGGGVR
jgi:hydantoinase/carbamoylase family amidase